MGEDRWLDEGVDGTSANVVEEAVRGSDTAMVASELLRDLCGASAGSGGGTSGDTDLSLRLPPLLTVSVADGTGLNDGEYCVPASTICFEGEFDDLVDVDRQRLRDVWAILGDCEQCRGKAAGEGGLTNGRGELETGNRYVPLLERGRNEALEEEGAVPVCKVGDGEDAIISISRGLLLLPERSRRVRELILRCDTKVRAYL